MKVDKMELGKLKKVDLRKIWKKEASDFTNWLSEEENLTLLGDEIGIDIKLLQTEASTGRYNVDILVVETILSYYCGFIYTLFSRCSYLFSFYYC